MNVKVKIEGFGISKEDNKPLEIETPAGTIKEILNDNKTDEEEQKKLIESTEEIEKEIQDGQKSGKDKK